MSVTYSSLLVLSSIFLIVASPVQQGLPKAPAKPSLSEALNQVDQKQAQPTSKTSLFFLERAPEQGVLTLGQVPVHTKRLVVDGREVRFASDGRFAIGFGRDYATSTLITAFLSDGRALSEHVAVKPHQWLISNLSTLPHHSQPDAEFQARRPGEIAQINAARHIVAESNGWRQHFSWPAHARISDPFGSQRIYSGQAGGPHFGVDLAVPQGTPIAAPADGVVILAAAAPFTLEGNLLMVDHGFGVNSAFLHLSKIVVKVGDHIKQGQLMGYSGMTGRATGPHLHWAIKWNDERIDPQSLTGPMR